MVALRSRRALPSIEVLEDRITPVIYMQYEGVPGESSQAGHAESIQVESFSFGVGRQPGAGSSSSDREASQPSVQEITVIRKTDSATSEFFMACASGKHIPEVQLNFQKADGSQEPYLKIELENVLISGYQIGGSSHGDPIPTESISLNFAKIESPLLPQSEPLALYYKATFKDAMVTSINVSPGGDRPMESISMNFTRLEPQMLSAHPDGQAVDVDGDLIPDILVWEVTDPQNNEGCDDATSTSSMGEHIPDAVLTRSAPDIFLKIGQSLAPTEPQALYYKATFKDALVTSINFSSSGDRPMESISVNFTKHSPGQLSVQPGDYDGDGTFDIICNTDTATPELFQACATGEHIPSVELKLCKVEGTTQVYMQYKMTDVVITSFAGGGQSAGDAVPTESISFNFVKVIYLPDAQHQFAGGVLVAAGDVNGDGFADIITGIGTGTGPQGFVFCSNNGTDLSSFFANTPGLASNALLCPPVEPGSEHEPPAEPPVPGPVPDDRGDDQSQPRPPETTEDPPPPGVELIDVVASVAVGDVNGDGRADIITFRAEVVPQFWLLTTARDALGAYHFDVQIGIGGTPQTGVGDSAVQFCVQYRESDFNFASRLMLCDLPRLPDPGPLPDPLLCSTPLGSDVLLLSLRFWPLEMDGVAGDASSRTEHVEGNEQLTHEAVPMVQQAVTSPAQPETPASTNTFTAIPTDTLFRPLRKRIKRGTVGTVAIGPAGEILVDKNGRVKVRFHWDRMHSADEAAAWVRAAQSWAGKRWGFSFLPRIGQEVIVAFHEGNPDQPLVIGTVRGLRP